MPLFESLLEPAIKLITPPVLIELPETKLTDPARNSETELPEPITTSPERPTNVFPVTRKTLPEPNFASPEEKIESPE
jgi:hypothetical protein